MQFIDLKAQYQLIKHDLDQRFATVFNHGQFILGPEVYELEQQLASYVKAKHCITISNGTDALLAAMMALDIGPGDEVITTPFSFIATAEMIMLLGARPVFVDIDPKTYNIDPGLIEQAITPKTKAILPVNLYGQCADYDAINAIAQKYNLHVIEDAAQSFGATYKGRESCALATISCASFFPSKPLGCYGDGGACFTDDDDLAKKLCEIRNHGQDRRYHHLRLGINGRLDTLQAAVLLSKLAVFPEELELRQQVAMKYKQLLADKVITPLVTDDNKSAYAQYTIQVERRDEVCAALDALNIPTAVHYPLPMHQQPILLQSDSTRYSLANTEHAAKCVLSLPFHPYMSDADIEMVANKVIQTVTKITEKKSQNALAA